MVKRCDEMTGKPISRQHSIIDGGTLQLLQSSL